MDFYSLKVLSVKPETADTKTIELEIPEALAPTFVYKAGQYITIKLHINDKEIRRSYSMSSAPHDAVFQFTVKKVLGGKASSHLVEQVNVGDKLEVAPPEGRFVAAPNPEKRRTWYLVGAGSGITPLVSIAKTVLEGEPMSAVHLLYGSRDEENIIFKEELDRLTQRYSGQFFMEYVLSQPKKDGAKPGLFGLFKKSTENWQGKKGRINSALLKAYLQENQPLTPESDCQYFICGPGDFAEAVKGSLIGNGVNTKQIFTELFLNATSEPGSDMESATHPAGAGKQVVIHMKGQRFELMVPEGQTILNALIQSKYDAPYSCASGACATCMAKVLSGTVSMDVCYALDEDEVRSGYVLTCQAKPQSDGVELSYDM